ncbi:hypothetical protein AM587_10009693 [Phytophthora nicotianae]|uniref:Uncharacterized protein n=1 Tax=Phytophthora nicotianae TaxID=4792 RepID=A0A0W8CI24_PHYNI|nr:hypothetical protein AM587_10012103 [Phytophthora nicotianae]KUF89353.1 hypothetical protein AM587_10009693 [Phytophthora nicotianae]
MLNRSRRDLVKSRTLCICSIALIMPSSTQASFVWVKYGFGKCVLPMFGWDVAVQLTYAWTRVDNITAPKMYNANVSCAILRSFVKNTCARDIEDLCKQKYIQLGIELDALNKALQAAQARSAAIPLATDGSSTSVHLGAEITAKKATTEYQLQVVATASKLAKELATGTALVDLADDHGTRLKLDELGDARANTILKSRAQYTAVAVAVDDKGSPHVVPLVFKLQKISTDAAPSRPSSGAAKSTGATAPT